MRFLKVLFLASTLAFVITLATSAQDKAAAPTSKVNKLTVLWYSGDQMVAERIALMYTGIAKQYNLFEDVSVIIWGPSAKLVAENKEIQAKI